MAIFFILCFFYMIRTGIFKRAPACLFNVSQMSLKWTVLDSILYSCVNGYQKREGISHINVDAHEELGQQEQVFTGPAAIIINQD